MSSKSVAAPPAPPPAPPGLQERLRSLLLVTPQSAAAAAGDGCGGGWDYVFFWRLNDEQRFMELACCCCRGAAAAAAATDSASSPPEFLSCPDPLPHAPTKTCALLSAMTLTASSLPLDSSGVHAQALLSGQPRWINYAPEQQQEGLQTKVFVPVHNGVVELGSSMQMSENAMVIQAVRIKCGSSVDPWCGQGYHHHHHHHHHRAAYSSPDEQQQQQPYKASFFKSQEEEQLQWSSSLDVSHTWEHDVGLDAHFSLSSSGPSFIHDSNNNNSNSNSSNKAAFSAGQQQQRQQQQIVIVEAGSNNNQVVAPPPPPPAAAAAAAAAGVASDSPHGSTMSKDSDVVKQEARAADSSECSDQVDEDEEKASGRSGRRHLSKNLVAERKRRKKLNERLYSLRALVPKITKMDRASILGDAIEYVKELQQQVKVLQEELEEETRGPSSPPPCLPPPPPPLSDLHRHHHHHHILQQQQQQGEMDDAAAASSSKASSSVRDNKLDDLTQPMQVEVSKMDAHLFALRIFCEKRPGVFLKLMQALDVVGLDVLHANITTFRGLVLNVFNAEIRDKEVVQQAEQVKETLLEMTSHADSRASADTRAAAVGGAVITIDG